MKKRKDMTACFGLDGNKVSNHGGEFFSTHTEQDLQTSPTNLVKLDLACGQNIANGFEGVDWWEGPNVKYVVNLLKLPWPWHDNTVDELHCSHYLEHIPMTYVSDDGKYKVVPDNISDKDLLCAFMDEAYRVLKPDGLFTIQVPSSKSHRGFQDPTHRRFWFPENFVYFNKSWREVNKLDHYNIKCDFDIKSCDPLMMTDELQLYCQEAATRRVNESWNIVADYVARLVAKK